MPLIQNIGRRAASSGGDNAVSTEGRVVKGRVSKGQAVTNGGSSTGETDTFTSGTATGSDKLDIIPGRASKGEATFPGKLFTNVSSWSDIPPTSTDNSFYVCTRWDSPSDEGTQTPDQLAEPNQYDPKDARHPFLLTFQNGIPTTHSVVAYGDASHPKGWNYYITNLDRDNAFGDLTVFCREVSFDNASAQDVVNALSTSSLIGEHYKKGDSKRAVYNALSAFDPVMFPPVPAGAPAWRSDVHGIIIR